MTVSCCSESVKDVYVVAGQSNAVICDWSSFEQKTNSTVVNIAIVGASIHSLIKGYSASASKRKNLRGVIFVHGETDSRVNTPPKNYVDMVERYRKMISHGADTQLPMYISTVGYKHGYNKNSYDKIRSEVILRAKNNKMWNISFNGAKDFFYNGGLIDDVHFSPASCESMIESILQSIKNNENKL